MIKLVLSITHQEEAQRRMQERSLQQLNEEQVMERQRAIDALAREEQKRAEARVALSRLSRDIQSGQITELKPFHLQPFDTAKLELVCRELEGIVTCRRVDLSGLGLTDVDINHIASLFSKNTAIESVFLDRNSIRGAGLRSLASSLRSQTSVRLISLEANDLTSGGTDIESFVEFVEELSQNQLIRTVSFAYCGLPAACIQAIAQAMTKSNSLVSVDVTANEVDDEGWSKIIRVCRANEARMVLDRKRVNEESKWLTREDRWSSCIRDLALREKNLMAELYEEHREREEQLLNLKNARMAELRQKQFEAGSIILKAYKERLASALPEPAKRKIIK